MENVNGIKNYADFVDLAVKGEIKEVFIGKTKYRLFVAASGILCYYKKGSSRGGYIFSATLFQQITKIVPIKTKTETENDFYKEIKKYKTMSQSATFTHDFINDCKKIPTLEEWIAGGRKGLYELGVTTGNRIDGKVISLKRIEKKYPNAIRILRDCIKNQIENSFITFRSPFAGYEMTISTTKNGTDFMAHLSLEYKGCGNGYYYLLINDENFIGYDVD